MLLGKNWRKIDGGQCSLPCEFFCLLFHFISTSHQLSEIIDRNQFTAEMYYITCNNVESAFLCFKSKLVNVLITVPIEPRLSRMVGTWVNSLDNLKYEY